MIPVHAGQQSHTNGIVEVSKLALVLPLPPSINHQYATVQGRRVLSRAGRDYKALVAEEIDAWREGRRLADHALAGLRRSYLSLTIHFYFATALRRDLDGGLKIAQDALCEALGINDNLVVEIQLRKRVDRRHPRIELELTALPEAVLHAEEDSPGALPPLPVSRRKRRRRRPQRSLEELASRYNW
jgi:crossover junction endodeoxyribonuclease RusA